MKIITADGRHVAVGGHGPLAAASPLGPLSGRAHTKTIRLAKDKFGNARSARLAEVASANPWVRAAVDARASVASRVPLHVFRPLASDEHHRGDRERVRSGTGGEGAQLSNVLSNPGPGLSGRRWRRRLLTDILVHGNAGVEEVLSGSTLIELAWHPWVDVITHPTPDGLRMEAYEVPIERRGGLWLTGRPVGAAGRTKIIDREDFVHLVVVDEISLSNGPVGVSPLESLHYTHALHDAAMRFAVNYMDNGIFPSGAVELDPRFPAAAVQATREVLDALHAGVERAGAPLAIAGKWQQLSATPEGAKLLELAKWSREEVAAAYRVPLPVLGDLSSSNRSTSQSAREQFIRDTVGDDVAVLESEFNAQLVARHRRWSAAGIWIEGELSEQLRPDIETRAKIYDVSKHWMTPNEMRVRENLPPSQDPRADQLIFDPGTASPSTGDGADPDDVDEDDVDE